MGRNYRTFCPSANEMTYQEFIDGFDVFLGIRWRRFLYTLIEC